MGEKDMPQEKIPETRPPIKKYEKYVLRDSYKLFYQKDSFLATPTMMEGLDSIFTMQSIVAPLVMAPKPHKHDFPQVLAFISSDAMNIHNFGALIELHLGEGADEEQYMITTNTLIAIPAGLYHCPIIVHRVDVAFWFVEFMLTGGKKYEKIFTDGTSSPR
ncbi:MAG: hypothetical protein N2506_01160 [Dehalococcoidales bacterium]|nr:hypothetical protein [Dehalococcoidales bacterium]